MATSGNNILMVTNADMSLQSGNVVLITRRAEEIYRQYAIKTTCLMLKRPTNVSRHNNEWIEFRSISNRQAIKKHILTYKPGIIILYGSISYLYIPYIKSVLRTVPEKTRIFLDIQGALEETFEFSNGTKKYIKYLLQKRIFCRAINSTDGSFVVTDELADYCINCLNHRYRSKFEIYKVRCGVNEIIETQQKMTWRKKVREMWGIANNTFVMVYSGYRSPWQKIDTIIEEFRLYDELMDNVFFAFFCNYDEAFERRIKITFPKGNYVIKFLSFYEYFEFLCACDVGFLIRDYKITNRVAFPNKFSDYLNAGLLVAINAALPEPFRILRESGIDFIDVEDKERDIAYMKMLKRHNDLVKFYHSTENICRKELLYESQIKNLRI